MRTTIHSAKFARGFAGRPATARSFLLLLLMATFFAAPAFGADAAPRRVLRVHVIHGLWDSYYGIDRGMAIAGVPLVSDSWHWMSWGFGYVGKWDQHPNSDIDGFPSPEALATTDLVIVCNINGAAFKESRIDALKKYVAGGGSVLFLGGRFTFGGQFAGTGLEEIAPVTFEKGIDLVPAPDGLVMTPTPDAPPWMRNLPWDKQARTYWRHRVAPKPGAKVLVTFGSEPAWIVGSYGKGRVALFAGTVLGAPKDGQTPLWAWEGWPGAMAGTISWLTEPRPRDADPDTLSLRTELAKAIEQDADGLPLGQYALKVEALAKHCHDQSTADFLVQLLASSQGDLPAAQIPSLAAAIRLYAGPKWAAQAKTLVDSGLQGKTAIGLRLLGAAGGPDALKTLTWFSTNAKVRGAGAALNAAGQDAKADDMALPAPSGGSGTDSGVVDPMVIRLGALEGLGLLGSPDAVTLLRQALVTLQDGKVSSSKDLTIDMLQPKHKLYEEALMAAVRCGHPDAVDPLFEAMLGNMNIVVRAKMELNKTDKNLKRAENAIGEAIDWEREMEERLLSLPEPAQLLVARKVGASLDRRVIRIASAAFAGKMLSAELKAELIKSRFPAVVDLAK